MVPPEIPQGLRVAFMDTALWPFVVLSIRTRTIIIVQGFCHSIGKCKEEAGKHNQDAETNYARDPRIFHIYSTLT
jgi:hypothetical protein